MGVTDKCPAEFSFRRHQNPRAYSTTPKPVDSEDSAKLKIRAVLRDISGSLFRGNVDEGMLDLLETLEYLQEDSVFMESLKSAYCWTAVECTLKFMWLENASDGLFSEVIERIWRKRIGILKEIESDLVSDELLNWESDLDKAFEEPEMYQRIRESNIRYNAMLHLNHLVKEQLALLGCTSLESEAPKMLLNGSVNVEGVVDVNEQEEKHEPSGDKSVAIELKDLLSEIEGVIGLAGQETNNVVDLSVDVTPPPNRTKSGGGQAEKKQRTLSASSSGRVRPYLPTPVPLNVLPLKMLKPGTPRLRRPVRFWTEEEVEALRAGVKVYGKAWKAIKDSNAQVFANRTEVDLKDKWRNLMRYQ